MLIDMTHTITPDIPVYPGTPAPCLSPACTFTKDGFRETLLTFSSHTGGPPPGRSPGRSSAR